jgi:cell wall-associated NlpC family hydrolase
MLKKWSCLVLVLVVVFFLWQFSVVSVKAAECIQTGLGCIPYDVSGFSTWYLKLVFGIAGGIAFLLLIYGFMLLGWSKGDPKKVQGAKETIVSVIIGLLLLIFGIFLYRFLVINVLNLPLTGNTITSSSGSSSNSGSGSSSSVGSSSSSGSNSGSPTGGSSGSSSGGSSGSSSGGSSSDDDQDSASVDDENAGGYTGGYYPTSTSTTTTNAELMALISDMSQKDTFQSKFIPCKGNMTEYQNQLTSEINSVGKRTREAVVVAAYYLASEFPYQVPYFLNGGHSDRDLDGGFLSSGGGFTTKWGCDRKVTNPKSSRYGQTVPNGLDCSGFVDWTYFTAGFHAEPSSKEYRYKKGNFEVLNFSNSNCGAIRENVKPGDVLKMKAKSSSSLPHTAVILAADDNMIKYAQSSGSKGVNISYINICTGKKTNGGKNSFDSVVFMENYFNRFGAK